MTLQQAVETIKGMTVHELAGMLHHAPVSLDGLESPGAVFLRDVRDAVAEALENDPANLDGDEWQHEAADGAVPIYTYEAWKTFIDLQGWESDHAEEVFGLTTESAQAVLYYLADEVMMALIQGVRDHVAEYDGPDEYDYRDYVDPAEEIDDRDHTDLYEEIVPNAGSAT